jgi:hypothetical protein
MIPKMIMMFTSFCVDGWADDYPGRCLMALFDFAAAGLALQLPARRVPVLRSQGPTRERAKCACCPTATGRKWNVRREPTLIKFGGVQPNSLRTG